MAAHGFLVYFTKILDLPVVKLSVDHRMTYIISILIRKCCKKIWICAVNGQSHWRIYGWSGRESNSYSFSEPVVLLFIYTVKFARFPPSSSPSYKVNPSAMKKRWYNLVVFYYLSVFEVSGLIKDVTFDLWVIQGRDYSINHIVIEF